MDVEKILSSIRTDYISCFIQEIKGLQNGSYVAIEAPLLEESGEIETLGNLELPSRNDCVVVNDESTKNYSFTIEKSDFTFEPLHLKWVNNVQVSIYPFQWGSCLCRLIDGPSDVDWHYLRQWFLKWFDDGISDEEGFLGCIHSMTDPVENENGYQFTIDFGSAPTDAIEDWIETVAYLGFKSASLGYTN